MAALRGARGRRRLGVTVFVEGEEEIGSPTFERFLAEHRERLAADVIVVADSGNWRVGQPALTTSLRGLVDGVVTVRILDHAVHSGMFGGAVLDAMTALLRLLASCTTRTGTSPSRASPAGTPTTWGTPRTSCAPTRACSTASGSWAAAGWTSRLWADRP